MSKPDRRPIWKRLCDQWTDGRSRRWSSRPQAPRPTMTAERARAILAFAAERGLSGRSRINPTLTRQQAHEILSKPIIEVPDGDLINSLMAKNIAREFGREYWREVVSRATDV